MSTRKSKNISVSPRQLAKDPDTNAAKLASLVGIETGIDRLVAKHPNTDEDTLRKLGSSEDKSTRKYVTANPNIPKEVLLDLASHFPGELLNNPKFDQLLLEAPGLLERVPLSTLRSLLKRDFCPKVFLTRVGSINDKGIQLSLAMNSSTPKSVLKKLAGVEDKEVTEAARLHVNRPGEVGDDWEVVFEDAVMKAVKSCKKTAKKEALKLALLSLFVRLPFRLSNEVMLIPKAGRVLAKQAFTPSTKLSILVQSEDRLTRKELALNPNTPARILKILAKDKYQSVAITVAENASAPDELRISLLKQFALSSKYTVDNTYWSLICAASNVDNSLTLLEELAKIEDRNILSGVASNPNTPVYLLEQLANRDEYLIPAYRLADNPNSPVSLLKRLANKNDSLVNSAIADNPNAPLSVLDIIAQDDAIFVKYKVSEHPNASEDLRKYIAGKIDNKPEGPIEEKYNIWVATNQLIPADVLESWIVNVSIWLDNDNRYGRDQRRYEDLLENLVLNPKLSVEMIERLLKRPSKYLHKYVLRSSNAQPDTLQCHALDKAYGIRLAAANNPNTPPEVIDALAEDKEWTVRRSVAKNSGTPTDTLVQLAVDTHPYVRASVAENTKTPIQIIQRVSAGDYHCDVRRVVAQNIKLQPDMLEKLAVDSDAPVRRMVAGNPRTPTSILSGFAHDTDEHLRSCLLDNPSLPAHIIEYLSMDRDRYVRRKAEQKLAGSDYLYSFERLNQLLSVDVIDLDLLAEIHGSEKIDNGVRKKLKKQIPEFLVAASCKPSKPSLSRLLAFMCKNAKPSVLARYYRSLDWKERCAIAMNPNTPPNIIENLVNDGNRIVRAAALSRGMKKP